MKIELTSDAGDYGFYLTRKEYNALGLARRSDVAAATNDVVVKVSDSGGAKTAVTIGSRLATQTAGRNSLTVGTSDTATGNNAFAQGEGSRANGPNSVALGQKAVTTFARSFVWNQASTNYNARAAGTYNINPDNGAFGVFIGGRSLYDIFRYFATNETSEVIELHDDDGEEIESLFMDAAPVAHKTDIDGVRAAVAAVSNEAQVVYRLFRGSNVVDEVTNYNSQVRLPSRRLYQLNESNTYHMVWNELDQHTNTLAKAKAYADDLGTNYAPRAWSRTTAMYGAEAPPKTTWISTPTTVIAAGYEYQKYATSGGAIWVLTSRGATYDFSPNTNNTAFLNIAAQDGTPIFRIEKTDSYLLGVNPTAISVVDDVMFADVDISAPAHPFVRVCEHLGDGWQKEEDGISASLATVNWTQTADGYRCTVANNTGGSSLFAYFEYLQEGGVKIVNGGLLDISGGLIVNGTTYTRIGTATISGHTVLTLEQ